MESKWFHHISFTKYIFNFFSKITALHQNVSNCPNTLTVLTLRWRIFPQDIWMGQMRLLPLWVPVAFFQSRPLAWRFLSAAWCTARSKWRPSSAATPPVEPDKEGNVLFNYALNTFYLRLYGIRHMVKDHSDSEKGNLLPPHRLLFPINSKGSFICIIPQTG